MVFTIIIFILTLLVLVVSHEFGHFITAKRFGVKVLEFGFGLPPRVFGRKIGETLVSLNWLPFGGFVRLHGEDETDKKILNDKRSFAAKTVWQRMVIVTAGVVMNFLLAALLFWIVLFAQGFKETIPLLTPYRFIGVNQTNESLVLIGRIASDSPAEKAGIKSGDQVIRIADQEIKTSDQLVSKTREYAGREVNFTLKSPDKTERVAAVVPRANPPAGQGALGVEVGSVEIANLDYQSFSQRLFAGFTHSYNLASYSMAVLGKYISEAFSSKSLEPVAGSVAGPIGITNVAGMILQTDSPLIPYLSFVAILSLNLAMINILPFPALDGGRLLFLIVELIARRRVKAEVERWVHTIGMIILIALIVLVTFSDIRKFF